jgi:XTP/dITP diphosphohydrolase
MADVDIIVATGNAGKMREIREICSDLPVTLTSLADHWPTVPSIAETGATFVENARIKAHWVLSRKGGWTLADDSGLEVDALGGAPGVMSARYGGEDGNAALNLAKLLEELRDVPADRRAARFRCVMVLAGPDGEEVVSEGACEGRIGFEPAGEKGFGYDPVFVPDGYGETFAQLASSEKNRISHRGRALASMSGRMHELFG